MEKAAVARKDIFHGGETGGDHGCRRHAVARRHPAEVEGLFDVLDIARPAGEPRGLLRGIGQQVAGLVRVEPGQRARRSRRPEGAAETVGRMPRAAKPLDPQRLGDPRADVIPEDDRAQQGGAAAPLALGHGQGRRHDAAPGMDEGDVIGVVGLVGMGQHPVGQRRVRGRGHQARAQDAGLARAAEGAHVIDRPPAGQTAASRKPWPKACRADGAWRARRPPAAAPGPAPRRCSR